MSDFHRPTASGEKTFGDLTDFHQMHWLVDATDDAKKCFDEARRHTPPLDGCPPLPRHNSYALSFALGPPGRVHRPTSKACLDILCHHDPDGLDREDAYGWAPVNYAAWFGRAAALDLLLAAGASPRNNSSPSLIDSILTSASHGHCRQRTLRSLKIAIQSGADPSLGRPRDPAAAGISWLGWTLVKGWLDVAEILYRHNPDLPDAVFQDVAFSAPESSLLWLQKRGVDVLGRLPSPHPAWASLQAAKARQQRDELCAATETDGSDSSTGSGGSGRLF